MGKTYRYKWFVLVGMNKSCLKINSDISWTKLQLVWNLLNEKWVHSFEWGGTAPQPWCKQIQAGHFLLQHNNNLIENQIKDNTI
jgi:hypothetical protein